MTDARLRVVIADDHAVVRQGIRIVLEEISGLEVVAEAADGRTAVELARKFPSDVVIMDIVMPTLSGIKATRQIKIEVPDVKIIALSMHGDSQYVKGMLGAGASCYLLKRSAFEELIQAIRAVIAGSKLHEFGVTVTSITTDGAPIKECPAGE